MEVMKIIVAPDSDLPERCNLKNLSISGVLITQNYTIPS